MAAYKDLIEATQAVFNLLKTKPRERPTTTDKYQKFLKGFESQKAARN